MCILLQPVLLLDMCVLRPSVLHMCVCSTAYFAALWTCLLYSSLSCPVCVQVCYSVVCATPEHVCSTVDCAATWPCLVYSSLVSSRYLDSGHWFFLKILGKHTYLRMKISFGIKKFSKYCQKRLLLKYGKIILLSYFDCFVKLIFFCTIPFRSELRNVLFRKPWIAFGIRTFFRGITEPVPSLFRGIFFRNETPLPTLVRSQWKHGPFSVSKRPMRGAVSQIEGVPFRGESWGVGWHWATGLTRASGCTAQCPFMLQSS